MTTYLTELRKMNPEFQQFDDETLIDALPQLDPQRFAGLEPDQVRTIATETTREYEVRQYEEQGGGLLSSLEKGLRRIDQTRNALGGGVGETIMGLTSESFQQSDLGQWLQGQADQDKQDVVEQQKSIEAIPSRPELNRAISVADTEDNLLGGAGAFLGELWESPDKLGLFVDLTAEQLPNLAIMAGTTYATGGLGSGLMANSLRMGGSTAVASGATTLGSNTAEAMDGDLNKFGEAFNKAALQSGIQAAIDGTVGAMVPIKIGGRQLINMPAQSLLQVAGGSTGAYAAAKAGGDDITQGEILAEGLLELLTMPADVATAAMDARRGNRANVQAEQLDQEQQQEEENTKQRAVDYLDNTINDARSRLNSLSEDAPAPLRQKAEAKLERYLMRKAQVLGEEVAPNQENDGQSETVTLMNGQVIPRSALAQLGGVQVNSEAKRFADLVYQNNEQLNQIEDPLERESAKSQSLSDEVSVLRQRQEQRKAAEQSMVGFGEGVVPSTSDDLGIQVAYARYQAQRGLLNRAMNQPLGLPQSTPEQAAEFERYQQQQERNRSAFEGQHGTARNTAREGELLSNEQEANYSWANRLGRYGEVIDGETLQDPLQIGQPVEPQPAQQGRLSGPRGLGLPAAEVLSNQPERTAANPNAVSYSQVDGSEAFNDAPSLRRTALSREVERARRSNTQTRFSTPQKAVIAEPYQPTAQELAAREASRQAMEEPYSGPRQSRKTRISEQVKLSKTGEPFKTEAGARLSRTFKEIPNAEVVPVDGGFGVRDGSIKDEPHGRAPSNQQAPMLPNAISGQNLPEFVAETPAQQSSKEEPSVHVAKSDGEIKESSETERQSAGVDPKQEEKPSDDDGSGPNLRTQGPSSESKPASVGAKDKPIVNQSESQSTKDDTNLSVGDNTDGMNADDVHAAVEPLINDLHERGTFEVVQSVNDLPFAIRLQAKAKLKKSKGENPVLRGINAGDKNYLIADGLRNEKEAIEIFLHEVVGHKAVLDMLGKDGDNIMERIAMSYGRKGLADLIDTYGADYATKEGRILLGKEKVAHIAERGEKPALLKRLVAKVKARLRNYFPSIKWSDNDVLSLISNARENVENRYMTKVDLEANTEQSPQEDNVNLSIINDTKEWIDDFKEERAQLKNNSTSYDRLYNSLGEKDKPVKTKLTHLLRRQFASGGLLPDSIFKEKISRDGEMNAFEFDISAQLQSFRKAIKHAYGKQYDELSPAQKMEINRQMSSQEVNKRIPVSVRASLMELRTVIKGLSKDYATVLQAEVAELEANGNSAEAAEKAQLLKTILDNLDTYAHRSYRAFDDPNWPRKVSKETMVRAVTYLKARYESKSMDSTQAEQKAMHTARSIIEEGTAFRDMGSFIKESKLGAKDLSTLKRRKEIAPEIRELLGEYHDAEINFAKTVTKMSRLVANHKFLKRVLEIGKREGFLFDKDSKPLNRSVVKIAAEGSEVLAPLNGLYTYPEVEQAFRDALGTQEKGVAWVDALVRLNGIVKYSKTVLSPTTAMRNIWSAFFFTVANGHFDMTHLVKSLSMRKEYFGGDTDKAKLEYLKKLKRLGVVYDSPYAGEMMDLLHDSRLEDTLFKAKPLAGINKLNEFAQKFYAYGDDMWKIVGFENEKALLMKHKRMSEEDAEVAAAERIRNTYPTYSMTGRFTQSLRRFPLAGTFVSFPAEIIRTTYHMLRYLKQDFKDSPEYAMRKVAGLALVSSLAFAAQGVSKALMGMDDEEEEAVRDMAAPWQKNSNLMFLGRDDNGNVQYLDLSFLDPYNYFKRPINAMMRDQSVDEMAVQSASEMLTPFFGEDITFGTLREIYTNKKETGGTVFNEQDSVTNQTMDITEHLIKGLQPGAANNAVRMYKAMNNEVSASGKEYKVEDEIAALFGFRSSTVDPKTALYYQSFDFKQSKTDASRVLKHVLRNPNEVSQSELADARDIMINSREQSYERMMRLVKSAKKSGMSNVEIRKVLKLSGISQKDVMSLMFGRMPKEDDYTKMAETIAERASILYGSDAGREVTRRANSL